jgi:putative tryptophan/tyrosine transport system substrate-binding protein
MRHGVCLPLLAACVAALPLTAAAQHPRMPVVGFLGISNPQTAAPWLAQWHGGLRDGSFVEGSNLAVEYRWAESDRTRVSGLVSDLVGRRIDTRAASHSCDERYRLRTDSICRWPGPPT